MDVYFVALIILASIAVMDLIVGVSNDAVNFLNSSLGSRVAPRHIILIIASFGILAGVLFSSGMMEVARKGIFHPQFFTMPELITLFLAVMIADILVLDLFNTFGLPTSTTVSIVFELLGAAVALSLLKIITAGESLAMLDQYINSAKALSIISGILLSVAISFTLGALVQFFSRLLFTFDYEKNLPRFGGLWGGISMASICLFILLKGAKGATFITPEMSIFIKNNLTLIFGWCFVASAVVFQLLIWVFQVNILKPIVLIGTFSLALAFAANDLVNFVGVPIAGFHSYIAAHTTSTPLSATMDMLSGKVPTSGTLLFLCGCVMVLALWMSKKARTVTETEIGLGSHDEENERFQSVALSRAIVRFTSSVSSAAVFVTPRSLRKFIRRRFDRSFLDHHQESGHAPSFDLLRASTNLMVASIVVSFATSLKLPLSTTYVTFMVAMGTSLADKAWGRETAVYRITGVLTVVGGWFLTAILASVTAGLFCVIIYYGQAVGVLALLLVAGVTLWRTHHVHHERAQEIAQQRIYNLRKITDARSSIAITFEQTAFFLETIRVNFRGALQQLAAEERIPLKSHYRIRKQLRIWSNVIAANVFKSMRLLHRSEIAQQSEYPRTITCLQSMADSYRDTVRRSYSHVRENHKRLLSIQIKELAKVEEILHSILSKVESNLLGQEQIEIENLNSEYAAIKKLVDDYTLLQNRRIHERSSKTRLSILYYALLGNMLRMAEQSLKLFKIYHSSLKADLDMSDPESEAKDIA